MRLLVTLVAISSLVAMPTTVWARTPDDPLFSEQWYLEKIGAPAAWDISTGSEEVVVAVLDSGADPNHPDLVGNLWQNADEIAGDGIDNDRNGYVDDWRGWDFVDADNSPEPNSSEPFSEDGVAHGTVISGLIGAVGNNGEGVAGVNWRVKIMPLRILDNFGAGDSGDARRAVEYAVAHGADVINLSFTGFDVDEALMFAINMAYVDGIPVVAAVGNSEVGLDLNETPIYPACLEGTRADWVIGVAATDQDDKRAEFSNYGSECVEIAAPGMDIFGLMYQNDDWADFSESYAGGWSGTSVAAPLVAGAIALLKSSFPSLTPTQVRTVLQLSVDPIQDQTIEPGDLGAGRLNIARAMEIAPSFAGESSAGPSTATTGLSPVTGEEETISTVAPGMFIRSPSFSTVYYVDEDYTRHPLWDRQTYFTWNDSWDEVTWVTDATLPTMPLGAVLPPKPGVALIKIQSDPRVFAVEEGATMYRPALREILNEPTARNLYGPFWNDYVIDLEPTLFSHYTVGEAMSADDAVDRSILKTREEL